MFDFFGKKSGGFNLKAGIIAYGRNKKNGSHDHRTNRGDDRTTAQRQGDLKRTKND